MVNSRSLVLERLLAAVVVTATLVHLSYYLPRVVDDLFISLRYAENLVHGKGLVYNVGERVEGFSSPAWVFLQALGMALRVEGVTFTKILGVSSLALLHVGLFRLTREVFGVRGTLALLPNVFLALDSHVIFWSILGLETPGFLAALVWTMVLVRRATSKGATRAQMAAAVAVAVLLAAMRPEAPAWVLVVLACERDRIGRVAIPFAIGCTVLLIARKAYYGQWVAHTYFVKGSDTHFEIAKLSPLVRHGTTSVEAVFIVSGLLLLVVAGLERARAAPALVCIAVLAFTAQVEADWMPSLRHLLPVLVLAPVGWAWLAERVSKRWRLSPAVAFAFALAAGSVLARAEARNTLEPFADGKWSRPKTMEKWRDAILALRRIEPPHVRAMDDFQMGMITQNYRLLEASAAPLERSWYVGRDIGKVGFYVEANVFDIAGLFTPTVVRDEEWRKQRKVSDALVSNALRLRPVAIEVYEDWSPAFGRNRHLLGGYEIVNGSPMVPIDLDRRGDGPSPEEILARYERSLAKFPRLFHLATLFGEHVGAAMEKRARVVRSIVEDLRAVPAPPEDAPSAGNTLDDGALRTRGCVLSPSAARPGDTVRLHCFFDVAQANGKPWTVFVHVVEGAGNLVFTADHPPALGLAPSTRWRAGTRVHDVVRFVVPHTLGAGTYPVLWGLYRGATRATATGPAATSDQRLVGPELTVLP